MAGLTRWQDFNFTRLQDGPILDCPKDTFYFEDPSLFYDAQHGVW